MKKTSTAILFLISFALSCAFSSCRHADTGIEHGIIWKDDGKFAAWPANNGMWIWGDEVLVGFVVADHKADAEGLHTYDPLTARNHYARSMDGGKSWKVEEALMLGQTATAYDNVVPAPQREEPRPLDHAISDFTHPDFIFTFMRHNNHNGPSHFYYSTNRGQQWEGPYSFPDLNTPGIASRTDYLVDGQKSMNAFLTIAKANGKEGRVAMARTEDGARSWEIVSWLGEEHEGFDIMPASLQLNNNRILTIIRTRTEIGRNLLTSYMSNDNGKSWTRLTDPVPDTGRGGTPPALVKMSDGRLALAYIYRSTYGSRVNLRFSTDEGQSWGEEIVLRCNDGANRDCGYPRMVQRPDGKLLLVYYWNHANQEGETPYRYIASTLVDPSKWK